jgi:hypothetical protein
MNSSDEHTAATVLVFILIFRTIWFKIIYTSKTLPCGVCNHRQYLNYGKSCVFLSQALRLFIVSFTTLHRMVQNFFSEPYDESSRGTEFFSRTMRQNVAKFTIIYVIATVRQENL